MHAESVVEQLGFARSANRTGSSGAASSWSFSARYASPPEAPRPLPYSAPLSSRSARTTGADQRIIGSERPRPLRNPPGSCRLPAFITFPTGWVVWPSNRAARLKPHGRTHLGTQPLPKPAHGTFWGMMLAPGATQNCASNAESTALKGTSSKVASWVCRYVSTSFMTALWIPPPRTAASPPDTAGAVAKAASRHHDLSTYLPRHNDAVFHSKRRGVQCKSIWNPAPGRFHDHRHPSASQSRLGNNVDAFTSVAAPASTPAPAASASSSSRRLRHRPETAMTALPTSPAEYGGAAFILMYLIFLVILGPSWSWVRRQPRLRRSAPSLDILQPSRRWHPVLPWWSLHRLQLYS